MFYIVMLFVKKVAEVLFNFCVLLQGFVLVNYSNLID